MAGFVYKFLLQQGQLEETNNCYTPLGITPADSHKHFRLKLVFGEYISINRGWYKMIKL